MSDTPSPSPVADIDAFVEGFHKKLTRQAVLSFASCVHCGLCTDSCHYYLATGDPAMAPAHKVDQVRKLYKAEVDWLGRVAPWWVGGSSPASEEDLRALQDVVFGSCTGCRRCTFSCPFGVDTGLIIRMARGLLTAQGIAPAGVLAVSKDQWETGNQMAVSQQDYLETLEWLQDELRGETGRPRGGHPHRQTERQHRIRRQPPRDQVRAALAARGRQDLPRRGRGLDDAVGRLG